MSNLIFPRTDYAALDRLMRNRAGNPVQSKTIAYATTCQRKNLYSEIGGEGDYFIIQHHGSSIASVSRDAVEVTNAGWTSNTTMDRIGRVLTDNCTGWTCGIKGGGPEFRQFTRDRLTVAMPHDAWVAFAAGEPWVNTVDRVACRSRLPRRDRKITTTKPEREH